MSNFIITALGNGPLLNHQREAIDDFEKLHEEINRTNQIKIQAKIKLDALRSKIEEDGTPEETEEYIKQKSAYLAPTENAVNYRAVDKTLGIGIAELHGRRSTQEDRVKANSLPGFAELSEEDRKKVLLKTPEILQSIIANTGIGQDRGSTLCTAVILGNKIYSLNLGDSTAFSCKVSDDKIEVHQLNDIIQLKDKIRGQLSVKDALGDIDYEKDFNDQVGIIHTPQLKIHTLELKNNEKALVIVACDGLTEPVLRASREMDKPDIKTLSENWVGKNLLPIHNQNLSVIGATLAMNSYDENTGDNISCMVATVDDNAKYLSVFDGHGGDEVSDAAYQLFDAVLNNQILLAKLKLISEPLVKKLESIILLSQIDKSIEQSKKSFEDYNVYLTQLIANSAQLTPAKIEEIILIANQVDIMCDAIKMPIKTIRSYRADSFPTENFPFLNIPVTVAKNQCQELLINVENAFRAGKDLATVKKEKMGMVGFDQQAQLLYEAAKIMLDIRSQYNKAMPSSFNQEAFKKFKNKNKHVIQSLENYVELSFSSYPRQSVLDIIQGMKKTIESNKNIKKTTYDKLFNSSSDKKLERCLIEASNTLSTLENKIKPQPKFSGYGTA